MSKNTLVAKINMETGVAKTIVDSIDCVLGDLVSEDIITKRQSQIAAQIIRNKSNKEVANDFGIVERTVEYHRNGLYRIIKVSSGIELLLNLLRMASENARPTAEVGKDVVKISKGSATCRMKSL